MKVDNKIYLYDGSFVNLLTLINELIRLKIKPLDIKSEYEYEPNLIDETFKMDIISENKSIRSVIDNISIDAFKIVYYVFLSSEKFKEIIIFYFILNGYKYGERIVYLRNLKCVSEALRISKYVKFEAHKLKGFVRFKEYENKFLYAEIEPTNDILQILSNHFKERLKNENWIIKDVGRNIISLYDKSKVYIIKESDFDVNKYKKSDVEFGYEALWKAFFKTIGIKERKNKRCQMNFMPKKYWNHILEMEDNYE